jgi:hypothetical protein
VTIALLITALVASDEPIATIHLRLVLVRLRDRMVSDEG